MKVIKQDPDIPPERCSDCRLEFDILVHNEETDKQLCMKCFEKGSGSNEFISIASEMTADQRKWWEKPLRPLLDSADLHEQLELIQKCNVCRTNTDVRDCKTKPEAIKKMAEHFRERHPLLESAIKNVYGNSLEQYISDKIIGEVKPDIDITGKFAGNVTTSITHLDDMIDSLKDGHAINLEKGTFKVEFESQETGMGIRCILEFDDTPTRPKKVAVTIFVDYLIAYAKTMTHDRVYPTNAIYMEIVFLDKLLRKMKADELLDELEKQTKVMKEYEYKAIVIFDEDSYYPYVVKDETPVQLLGACKDRADIIIEIREDLKSGKIELPAGFKQIKKEKEEPDYWNYEQAQDYCRRLKIPSKARFKKMKRQRQLTNQIPSSPDMFYYKDFTGWNNFLGVEIKPKKKQITLSKIDTAIKKLKENWDFYMRQKDGWLLDVFDSWGLFEAKDHYKKLFFQNFCSLRQSEAGRAQLMEIIASGRFDMIGEHLKEKATLSALQTQERDVRRATRSRQVDDVLSVRHDLPFLFEDEELGVHKILHETDQLIPDEPWSKVFKLHVRTIVLSIWKELFDEIKSDEVLQELAKQSKSGLKNLLKQAVIRRVLWEFREVHKIYENMLLTDYRGEKPNMMQLYTAYKLKTLKGFCNFSRTGTGKTKAGIISTRITKSYRTLVICPFNIVFQWGDMIHDDYPLSNVSYGKKLFETTSKRDQFGYHVINYDKFSRESAELIIDYAKEMQGHIDMVILDEAQYIKQREEVSMSARRRNVELLLTTLRQKNPDLKLLVLTATPVINNIREGVKLLEMVADKPFPHLKTERKLRNASRLYTEFLEYSIRYYKKYNIKLNEEPIYVDAYVPDNMPPEQVRELNWNGFERIATPARIPEIIKLINGRTIIYTEFTTEIIDMLTDAVKKAGYRVGYFTGDPKYGKEGLVKPTGIQGQYTNPFVNGDIDVLIASSPVAEGIDGLQKVCNNLILNGLPWTYARLEQIIGRLVRTGQTKRTVNVSLVLARIEGYDYDQKIKRERIHAKEMLMMCALDGVIPDMSAFKTGKSERQHMIEKILLNRNSRLPSKAELKIRLRKK